MSNCSIGSIIRAASLGSAGHAGALQSIGPAFRLQRPVRSGATPADLTTLTTPAVKPSRTNTMSPHGEVDSKRSNPQPISRADDNAGDQLRRKPEPERHRRGSGSSVSAFSSGLVSPDFAAVPNFGQPVIQTSEPCGKRSFVRGRLIATSISAVVRAFSHAVETRNDAAWMEMTPRHPQKPRGPYLPRLIKSRLRRNWLAY